VEITPRSGLPAQQTPKDIWSVPHNTNIAPGTMAATQTTPRRKTLDLNLRDKASKALQQAIEQQVNDFSLEGAKVGDQHLPKLLALLNAANNIIPDLWRKINNSHITNSLVHEMFLTSMRIENEAKQALLVSIAAKEKDPEEKVNLFTLVKTYSITSENATTRYDKYIERAQKVPAVSISLKKVERQCNQLITEIGLPEAIDNRYDLVNTDFEPEAILNKDATSLRGKINHALFAKQSLMQSQETCKRGLKIKKETFDQEYCDNEKVPFSVFEKFVAGSEDYKQALNISLGNEQRKLKNFDDCVRNAGKSLEELMTTHEEKRIRFLDLERQWVSTKKKQSASSKKRKKRTQPETPTTRPDIGSSDDDDSPIEE